jgi:hypothetical protein
MPRPIVDRFEVTETEALDLIVQKIREKRLALLCGAGVSRESPANLPLARELTSGLVEAIATRVSKVSEKIEEVRALALEDFITRAGWGLEFAIDEIYGSHVRPTAWHVLIAQLLKAKHVQHVFTTNFDTLLEQAVREAGLSIPFDVDAFTDEFVVVRQDSANLRKKPEIVHLHGVARHVNPVVTLVDLATPGENADRLASLVEFIEERDNLLLTVGYSASDADVSQVLEAVSDRIRSRALLVRRRSKGARASDSCCLARLNPLVCEVDNHADFRASVTELLNLPPCEPSLTTSHDPGKWEDAKRRWVESLSEEALDETVRNLSSTPATDYGSQFQPVTFQMPDGVDLRMHGEGVALIQSGSELRGSARMSLSNANRGFSQCWYLIKRARCRGYLSSERGIVRVERQAIDELCHPLERELRGYVERYEDEERQSGWYLQYPGYRAFVDRLYRLMSRHDFLHALSSAPCQVVT